MLTKEQISKKARTFVTDVGDSHKLQLLRTNALTFQDFYRGKHWTKDEWDIYQSKGVDPVTVNRCKPIVKTLIGMYLNNRQSIRVRPRKDTTEACAQVWSEVFKHSEDRCHADSIYTGAFGRGLIDAEGYLTLDVDKSKTVNGQTVVRDRSVFDVDVDPNCGTYDLNDSEDGAKYVIIKDWADKDVIEARYPDEAKDGFRDVSAGGNEMGEDVMIAFLNDDLHDDKSEMDEDDELKKKYRYRLKYVWWRETAKGALVADRQTGQVKVVSEKTDRKYQTAIKKARKSDRFEVTDWPVFILHKTIMLGSTMLEDIESPFGEQVTDLPVFRFSPYYYDGVAGGQLDDLVSLNREENIHQTQLIKVLNKTANSGWKINQKMNQADYDMLKNFGDVDGVVLDESKFGGKVEKIEPNQFPVGFFTNAQSFEDTIKKVAGIDDASMGIDSGRAESGKAISLRQQQNQISSNTVFENFYYTLELLGVYMLEVIRKNDIYTDEEIKNIVAESTLVDGDMLEKARVKLESTIGAGLVEPEPLPPPSPEMLAQIKPEDQPRVLQTIQQGLQSAKKYAKAYPAMKKNYDALLKRIAAGMMLEKLRTDEVAEYGVDVSVSPSAPTERLLRFMEMDSLNKNYPGIIPADIMIDATDLPNKDEIKARLTQMQQAQAAQAQMQGVA